LLQRAHGFLLPQVRNDEINPKALNHREHWWWGKTLSRGSKRPTLNAQRPTPNVKFRIRLRRSAGGSCVFFSR
jgi:hypothetical protein